MPSCILKISWVLRKLDHKAQISLYDQSIQDEHGESLLLNIFRPCEQMPDPNCGDVVLIFGAKVCSMLPQVNVSP